MERPFYKILGLLESASSEDIKNAFKRLAKKYHPDHNPGSLVAEETFKKLVEAYEVLSDPDKRAKYDKTGTIKEVIIPSKTHKYKLGTVLAVGDLTNIYNAEMEDGRRVVLKVSSNNSVNDLLEAEAKNIVKLRPSGSPEEKEARRFPHLIESFKITDGSLKIVNVFDYLQDFFSFDFVQGKFRDYGNSLRFEHPIWMFNRILETLIVVHRQNLLHLGIIPPHLMVFGGKEELHPMNHGVKLIDWAYSIEVGNKAKAISPNWEQFYPPEVLSGGIPGASADIYMAAKSIQYILESSPTVPIYFYNFLKGCVLPNPRFRPNDALSLYREFKDHIKQNYGPKQYFRFDIP